MLGPNAHAEIISVAFAGKGQHQDAGAIVVHIAPNTTSRITSKSLLQLTTASLKQEEEYEEELVSGVPICGSNLSTPVVDRAYHTAEIYYRIGDRMYIENAD